MSQFEEKNKIAQEIQDNMVMIYILRGVINEHS